MKLAIWTLAVLLFLSGANAFAAVYASPRIVENGTSTQLTAPSMLSGYPVYSWTWSDFDAGGHFWPSNTDQFPIYTAPGHWESEAVERTIRVQCYTSVGSINITCTVWELPYEDKVTVEVVGATTLTFSEAPLQLTASAVDSWGHPIVQWEWSDNGAGGSFANPTARSILYYAPTVTATGLHDINITVTATCEGGHSGVAAFTLFVRGSGDAPDSFDDVEIEHWASAEIMACARAGIVRGYDDGLYRPDAPITRDMLAVFFARAFQLISP